MNTRKHNGITLRNPNIFGRRNFKFGTRRAIEKREQIKRKQLVFNEVGVPRLITNPAWPGAVRTYFTRYWHEAAN